MKIRKLNESEDILEYRRPGSLNKSTLAKRAAAQQNAQPQAEKEEPQTEPMTGAEAIASADSKEEAQDVAALLNVLGEDTEFWDAEHNPDQMEAALDLALKENLMMRKAGRNDDYINVGFSGAGGTGKTSRINAWARKRHIHLINITTSEYDPTDFAGIVAADAERTKASRLASTEFDEADNTPNTVLFLDEFNRAKQNVRAPLLNLVQSHIITDPRVPGKKRKLKNLLFTICAINPASDDNNQSYELNDPERGRFTWYDVAGDPEVTRKWSVAHHEELAKDYEELAANEKIPGLQKQYQLQAQREHGRANLVNALLMPGTDFHFDDAIETKFVHTHSVAEADMEGWNNKDINPLSEFPYVEGNDLPLSPRTLERAIQTSDGTKEGLFKVWNNSANSQKLALIKKILKNYKDKDDKANDALKNHETQSSILTKQSKADKLRQHMRNRVQ